MYQHEILGIFIIIINITIIREVCICMFSLYIKMKFRKDLSMKAGERHAQL